MLEIDESIKKYNIENCYEYPGSMIELALGEIKKDQVSMGIPIRGSYSRYPLGKDPNHHIGLDRVYENGLVYRLQCIPDTGTGKYDTATSILLFVKNNGDVKYLLEAADYRCNEKMFGDRGFGIRKVNEDFIAQERANMGAEIDGTLFQDHSNDGFFATAVENVTKNFATIRDSAQSAVNQMVAGSVSILEKCLEDNKEMIADFNDEVLSKSGLNSKKG